MADSPRPAPGRKQLSARTSRNMTPSREIFISLTNADAGIADAISNAVRDLFGETITVSFSTDRGLTGGIRHGEDWFKWILDRVRRCDFAFVLITPSSFQKPWILWEAGAIYGIMMMNRTNGLRKIRPILFQLEADQIPSPIRDSRVQFKRGDRIDDIKSLFQEILDEYREVLSTDRLTNFFEKHDQITAKYLDQIDAAMRKAPLLHMADHYLEIKIADWRERVRAKNEFARKMGEYVIVNHIPKKDLVHTHHEGVALALASAIRIGPGDGDINLLLLVAKWTNRLHVRHRILQAIDELFERGYVRREDVPSIQSLLESYRVRADGPLLNLIEQTRYTLDIET